MAYDYRDPEFDAVEFATANNCELGAIGESLGAAFLEAAGWKILQRNARVGRLEIDIIAEDGLGALHFVEVKTRRGRNFGDGREAITPEKLGHMRRAAVDWLVENAPRRALAIDCIEVTLSCGSEARIEYLGNIGEGGWY